MSVATSPASPTRVSVPEQHTVAGRYWRELSLVELVETVKLLASSVHEERLTALFILAGKFTKGEEEERGRIFSIVFAFIKAGDFHWTFRLGERLLRDPHDLVHKAVGWMLREVGNRDRAAEEEFLARHYRLMPRVMLRYAIEKFDPQRRRGTCPPGSR